MRLLQLAPSALAALTVAQAQVVQWDIQKQHATPRLRRRAGETVQENVSNERGQGGYFATVKVGSPGQELSLQLDTGSSDIWVPYTGASICTDVTARNPGCTLGSFDPDKSDTFDDVHPNQFQIQYQDKSYAEGDYFEDDFQLGGSTIQNLTMGLGLKTTINFGLVGVGYAINEAYREVSATAYPNLPIAMQNEGLINTVAYSLWLNDLGANKGNILFGGIDTDKYVGDLTKLAIIPQNDTFVDFSVKMTSLEASSPSGSDVLTSTELPFEVVLDSGTTLTYLPQDMAQQVWEEAGVQYEADAMLALIPCSFANHDGYFSFGFAGPNGPRINVTMDELVVDLGDSGGPRPTFPSGRYQGQDICEFGIQNQTGSPYLLGDTFLRSAYVVYDLVNNEIGIAATDFNSTKSNIVPFASKGASIPSATSAVETTATATAASDTATSTQTGLSAANGFQADGSGGGGDSGDSGASFLHVLSPAGLATTGMATLFVLLGSFV